MNNRSKLERRSQIIQLTCHVVAPRGAKPTPFHSPLDISQHDKNTGHFLLILSSLRPYAVQVQRCMSLR